METAAQMAKNQAAGIESIGNTIAGAIKQYSENEKQRQVLGPQIGQFLKSDPTLAESLDPKMIEKFKLGKATLDEHKSLMGEISTNMLIKQKGIEEERAKLENQRVREMLADSARKRKSDELLNTSLTMNTDTDGNVDIGAALKTFISGGGSLQDSALAPSLSMIKNIQFGAPKMQTLEGGNGRKVDIVETGPGKFDVLPDQRPAQPMTPESPLGKLMADRDAALLANNQKDAASIQSMIDGEVKKAAEGAGAKALTDAQSNSLSFSLRLMQNEDLMKKNQYDTTALFNGSWTPERFKDQELKAYNAAKKNWIAASLRRQSGATITPTEYKEWDEQYFPQPGDGAEVIAQKAEMRAQETKAMVATIGPDAERYIASARYVSPEEKKTNEVETKKLPNGVTYQKQRLK
jgi:hypothetical protein